MIDLCRRIMRRGYHSLFGRQPQRTPEEAACELLANVAKRTPRFTRGSIRLLNMDIGYNDIATTFCQWRDIFVGQQLRFNARTRRPAVLDCGANIGLATLYFKRLYPEASVTAIEPDPRLFEILKNNITNNDISQVNLIQAAAWTENGEVCFRGEGSDSGALEALSVVEHGFENYTVPAIRLRDLLERESFDLVKMDIEGAEREVLLDCAPILNRIPALIVELHETEPSHRMTVEVLSALESAGFRYTLDQLLTMTWRPMKTHDQDVFPKRELRWVVLVWAWRPAALEG